MPLGDVTYINDALDALVASWPASGATYNLFSADPSQAVALSDVELTSDGGYAGATFAPGDWSAAADGGVSTTDPVSFGTSTAAYSDVATYWGVVDTSGLLVFSDPLTDPIEVPAAGTTVAFTPTLTFADGA